MAPSVKMRLPTAELSSELSSVKGGPRLHTKAGEQAGRSPSKLLRGLTPDVGQVTYGWSGCTSTIQS